MPPQEISDMEDKYCPWLFAIRIWGICWTYLEKITKERLYKSVRSSQRYQKQQIWGWTVISMELKSFRLSCNTMLRHKTIGLKLASLEGRPSAMCPVLGRIHVCKVTTNIDGWLKILTTCTLCKHRMMGARQLPVEDGWIKVPDWQHVHWGYIRQLRI